ncbi:uncharacterized protein B0I36DRAFT_352278 [Microdochium trichocladiopsis]|uniref:Uncharacterized protein n=1 Tax=Microdochium trichocladiopsis TaxID=1682393 RepID=A0A9P8Y0A6_9PEZI|nr:uncharacterized protein B0I36DRAFT_352278 [Microdochium trichocladiopsis]KAH7026417.1 hypothetical protein B0I36DRAFT_352278 [Microdochium trichocladiopsis]
MTTRGGRSFMPIPPRSCVMHEPANDTRLTRGARCISSVRNADDDGDRTVAASSAPKTIPKALRRAQAAWQRYFVMGRDCANHLGGGGAARVLAAPGTPKPKVSQVQECKNTPACTLQIVAAALGCCPGDQAIPGVPEQRATRYRPSTRPPHRPSATASCFCADSHLDILN